MPVLDPLLTELPAELDQLALAITRKIDQALERTLQPDAHAVEAEHRFQQLLFGTLNRVARLLRPLSVITIRVRTLHRVFGHPELFFEVRAQGRELGDLRDDRAHAVELPIRLVDRVRPEPLHGSTILCWMDAEALRQRLAGAAVARLATVGADGKPHLVPIVLAVERDTIYFAVDAKPKRTTNLQRLKNIAANPAVCVLVDHYEDDWSKLWWVRVDGTARILADNDEASHAIDMLVNRYEEYRNVRPAGPVVAIAIERVTGWSAA